MRIQTPGGDILLATTHITPGNLADLERSEGMLEFYEIAKLLFEESAKTGVKNMLMAGDLNSDPPKMIYHIFPALTGFQNAFSVSAQRAVRAHQRPPRKPQHHHGHRGD